MGVFSVFDMATCTAEGPSPAGEHLTAGQRLVVREPGIPAIPLERLRIAIVRRCVLAHDLVEGKHLVGEPLCDGAVLRIVCEAVRDRDVEGAVAVGVARARAGCPSRPRRAGSLRGERARARRRGLRGRDAIRTSAAAARGARGSTRVRHAATARSDEAGPVAGQRTPRPAEEPAGPARAPRPGARPVGRCPLPAPRARGWPPGPRPRVCATRGPLQPVSCAGQPRAHVCVPGTTPGIEAEQGPERERNQFDDLGAVERCGSRAEDNQPEPRGRARTTAATGSTRCAAWESMAVLRRGVPGIPACRGSQPATFRPQRAVRSMLYTKPFAANVRALGRSRGGVRSHPSRPVPPVTRRPSSSRCSRRCCRCPPREPQDAAVGDGRGGPATCSERPLATEAAHQHQASTHKEQATSVSAAAAHAHFLSAKQ